MTEMTISRIAIWLASALVLLGSVAAQQSPVTSENQTPQAFLSSESQIAPCQSQPPTAKTPFDTCKYLPYGPGIRPPKPVSAPDPTYPEPARQANLKGTVVLALAINDKGHVDDVKIVRSSNQVFEQNAIDAAKQWVFLPALKSGKPVAVQENVEMGFSLY